MARVSASGPPFSSWDEQEPSFFSLLFRFIYLFCLHVGMCTVCIPGAHRSTGTAVGNDCDLPCGCRERNPVTLQTSESSLQRLSQSALNPGCALAVVLNLSSPLCSRFFFFLNHTGHFKSCFVFYK